MWPLCQGTRYELKIQQQRLDMNASPGFCLICWRNWCCFGFGELTNLDDLKSWDVKISPRMQSSPLGFITFFGRGTMKFVKLNKQINIPQTPSLSFVSFFFFFCVDWSRLVVTERLLALASPVWRKLLPWIVASKIIWTSQAKLSWIVMKQHAKENSLELT